MSFEDICSWFENDSRFREYPTYRLSYHSRRRFFQLRVDEPKVGCHTNDGKLFVNSYVTDFTGLDGDSHLYVEFELSAERATDEQWFHLKANLTDKEFTSDKTNTIIDDLVKAWYSLSLV